MYKKPPVKPMTLATPADWGRTGLPGSRKKEIRGSESGRFEKLQFLCSSFVFAQGNRGAGSHGTVREQTEQNTPIVDLTRSHQTAVLLGLAVETGCEMRAAQRASVRAPLNQP